MLHRFVSSDPAAIVSVLLSSRSGWYFRALIEAPLPFALVAS